MYIFVILKTCFQIRVNAIDAGTPPLMDTTVVDVKVDRNLHAPRMQEQEYRVRILETQDLGVGFQEVRAQDEDQKV